MSLVILFSQLVCWNTVYMESDLKGISCLNKSFSKSGQNLSVDLSDHVTDVVSILYSIVQITLIESQFERYGCVPED